MSAWVNVSPNPITKPSRVSTPLAGKVSKVKVICAGVLFGAEANRKALVMVSVSPCGTVSVLLDTLGAGGALDSALQPIMLHASIAPPSSAKLSLTVSVQIPPAFCPLKTDSASMG